MLFFRCGARTHKTMSANGLNKKTARKTSGEPQNSSSSRQHYRWLGYGVEFMGVLALFMWLGHLLDKKLQTTGPWWLLAGFFFAFVGMIYLLIKETFGIGRKK